MSQPRPTVHPLTENTNQAKANIEGIVFWVSTPVSCRQQVSLVSLLLLWALPPHVFPASPLGTLALLWEARKVEEAGWLRAVTANPNTQAWTWNVHACSPNHPSAHTHTQMYTSAACVHMQKPHTHTASLFSSVPASLCRVVRFIHAACQEHKCKKAVIVEPANFSVQLSTQFQGWSSLKSLKQQNMDTKVFQRHKQCTTQTVMWDFWPHAHSLFQNEKIS